MAQAEVRIIKEIMMVVDMGTIKVGPGTLPNLLFSQATHQQGGLELSTKNYTQAKESSTMI